GGAREVGGADARQAQQGVGVREIRMDLDDFGEQSYRRLRVLGANEGIGEVIGGVGVIRTLAHLGGQQWQCAFEVMPANERQAIVDGHVRACASNDVLVVNLR